MGDSAELRFRLRGKSIGLSGSMKLLRGKRMIDYMKPVGAFLEHTIRPLIQEAKWFLDELESKGLHINERNIKNVSECLVRSYFKCLIIKLIQNIIITGIVCLTTYLILA